MSLYHCWNIYKLITPSNIISTRSLNRYAAQSARMETRPRVGSSYSRSRSNSSADRANAGDRNSKNGGNNGSQTARQARIRRPRGIGGMPQSARRHIHRPPVTPRPPNASAGASGNTFLTQSDDYGHQPHPFEYEGMKTFHTLRTEEMNSNVEAKQYDMLATPVPRGIQHYKSSVVSRPTSFNGPRQFLDEVTIATDNGGRDF